MKRLLSVLTALLLITACTDDFEHPKPTPAPKDTPGTYRSDETAFPVGAIPTGTLHDAARNKDLPLVIEYPSAGQGPFPVVVFSHGYGSSNAGYVGLTEYWAGHGYVVIKPSHADAGALRELMRERRREMREEREQAQTTTTNATTTTTAAQPPQSNPVEEAWQNQTAEDWRNRARDIELVLDNFDTIEQQYPELKGKLDRNRIAVAGHSYGALVSMLLAGMTATRDNATLNLADPRIKAVIAMSPQGVSASRGLTAESWRNVHVPVLFMTGSEDRGVGPNEDAAWRRTAFENSPAGDKYFVSIEGANNLSFTGLFSDPTAIEDRLDRMDDMSARNSPYTREQAQTRSRGAARFERERNIYATVKTLSTAFLDAYMKSAPAAREYLNKRVTQGGGITAQTK